MEPDSCIAKDNKTRRKEKDLLAKQGRRKFELAYTVLEADFSANDDINKN